MLALGFSLLFSAGLLCEVVGLAAAIFPHQWLSLFGSDPAMLESGTRYLQIVGPTYGFFGFGLALYFASQGAGGLAWPLGRPRRPGWWVAAAGQACGPDAAIRICQRIGGLPSP